MSSEHRFTFHKEFQSLQPKRRPKVGAGVVPINNLSSLSPSDIKPPARITIPDNDLHARYHRPNGNNTSPNRPTSSSSRSYSSSGSNISSITSKAELLREELDHLPDSSLLDSTPIRQTIASHSTFGQKSKYHDVFHDSVDVSDVISVDLESKYTIELESLKINNKTSIENGANELKLHVSYNGNYIYFTNFGRIIDGSIIRHKGHLSNIIFSKSSIVFEMKNYKGYIMIQPMQQNHFRDFIRDSTNWLILPKSVTPKELDKYVAQLNQACQFSDETFKSNTRLTPLSSKTFFSPDSRSTRSRARAEAFGHLGNTHKEPISITDPILSPFHNSNPTSNLRPLKPTTYYDSVDDELTVKETPASFSPDLKYRFAHNKLVTITYNDFKTLYNNDWINDSVIDFFIQYEIDKAVHQYNLLKPDDIYALNSFFFTKLMSKSNIQDTPDYYGNIKRWLTKVDLMKYPYVVLPINENAHWYCCIIKGLPALLEKGLADKKAREENRIVIPDSEEKKDTFTFETFRSNFLNSTKNNETSKDNDQDDNETEMDNDSINESIKPDEISGIPVVDFSSTLKPSRKYQTEIFVFDSLAQTHSNISFPIKKFIIDYCADKYDIDIVKQQIRVMTAKVPKQNNFNDCGIHVIYNVKTWLNNIPDCERVWRGKSSRGKKGLFVAEERNNTRKQLIDILLKLHKEQGLSQFETSNGGADSDDDLEVIECTPTPEKEEKKENNQETKQEQNPTTSKPIGSAISSVDNSQSNILNITPVEYPTTLDPRAQSKDRFINIVLNQKLEGRTLNEHVVEMLNELFDKKNRDVPPVYLDIITDMCEELNDMEPNTEMVIGRLRDFKKEHDAVAKQQIDYSRPKNQEFVIDPNADIVNTSRDESDDVNESVSRLKLTSRSPVDKAKEELKAASDSEISSTSKLSSVSSSQVKKSRELPKHWKSPTPMGTRTFSSSSSRRAVSSPIDTITIYDSGDGQYGDGNGNGRGRGKTNGFGKDPRLSRKDAKRRRIE